MIVTEFCKKEDTWTDYRDNIEHNLSEDFLEELMTEKEISEVVESAKKDEKQTDQIRVEIEVCRLGSVYWKRLLEKAQHLGIIGYKEISLLSVAANMESTGRVPSQAQAKAIMSIRQKLDEQGIFVEDTRN